MADSTRTEDLAQLLARLKTHYDVNESEIARRIGVSAATVNSWVHRKRGTGRGPKQDSLRALHAAFPAFSEDEIFAAAGRLTPGPLDEDQESRVLEYFRGLTKEQKNLTEIQLKALNDSNRT